MKKISILLLIFIVALTLLSFTAFASAKNDPILTLQAEEGYLDGPANISGEKVGFIGLNGGSVEGTVTFYDLDIPEDGEYTMRVHYYSGSDDRYFVFTVDGVENRLDCPSTGSFDTVGTILMDIELKKGCTLRIGTDWYGPDLDKIEIFKKGAFDFINREYTDAKNTEFKNEDISLIVDTKNGVYSVSLKNEIIIKNVHAETIINETLISSDDFEKHECSQDAVSKKIKVVHSSHKDFDGTLTQEFTFEKDYITTTVSVSSGKEITTNYISVLSGYEGSLKIEDGTFLKFPFDNDMWEEPKAIYVDDLGHTTTSYEVGGYFSQSENDTVICGSLLHDSWKSGIDINAEDGKMMGFNLYAGVSDGGTRDKFSHGSLKGKEVSSPIMFIYVGDDWQKGLSLFGSANAEVTPPKKSVSNVPLGFNSWASLGISVDYSSMIEISDYIEKYLQDAWQKSDEPVYVNLDSYWDYINHNDPSCDMSNEEALESFVKNCKENGHKAGIYYTPFAIWANDENDLMSRKMEGSDYTYYDAALRSHDGEKLYGTLDGGYALDPTHPGTVARIEYMFNYFIELGFEYIKLDFTTHGALEGQHYLKDITTGIQAYNYGMEKIHKICDGKMFVNLSISPVFPHQYADGRRISCDAFASVDSTRHVLSYVTYCFWQKKIYRYPDPDHLLVTGVDESVARMRVTSGVISGTSFIIGDNLSMISENSSEHQRILKMYGNKDIINLAKKGFMFKPFEYDFEDKCASVYTVYTDQYFYIAVFNFGEEKTMNISLEDFNIEAPLHSPAKELWSGKTGDVFTIGENDAAIFRIYLKGNVDPDDTSGDDTPPSTDTVTPENTQIPSETTVVPETLPETQVTEQDNKEAIYKIIIISLIGLTVAVLITGAVVMVIKKKK